MRSQDMASRLSGEPPARNYVKSPVYTKDRYNRSHSKPNKTGPRMPQKGPSSKPPGGAYRPPLPSPAPGPAAKPFGPPAARWWGALGFAGIVGGVFLGTLGLRLIVTALQSNIWPAGWSQCPTPSCGGGGSYWRWTAVTSCATLAACPNDNKAAYVASGTNHATRRGLLIARDTNPPSAQVNVREQHIRSSAGVALPTEWILWDGLDLIRKWEREDPNQEYPLVDPAVRPPFTPQPAGGGKPIPYWAAPYRARYRIDRVEEVRPAPEPNGPARPPNGPARPPSWVPAFEFGAQGDRRWRNEKGVHVRRPPGPKEKERKVNVSKMMGAVIREGLSVATEFVDVVDAIYEALPESLRKKDWAKSMRENHRGLTPREKIKSIFDNGNSLDLNDVVDNIAEALIEDAILGQVGKATGRANRQIGHRGLAIGPAL